MFNPTSDFSAAEVESKLRLGETDEETEEETKSLIYHFDQLLLLS